MGRSKCLPGLIGRACTKQRDGSSSYGRLEAIDRLSAGNAFLVFLTSCLLKAPTNNSIKSFSLSSVIFFLLPDRIPVTTVFETWAFCASSLIDICCSSIALAMASDNSSIKRSFSKSLLNSGFSVSSSYVDLPILFTLHLFKLLQILLCPFQLFLC